MPARVMVFRSRYWCARRSECAAQTFRRFHQCTIGEYLRRVRIEYACRELAHTETALSDIAAQAGFVGFAAAFECAAVAVAIVRLQPRRLVARWTRYHNVRGMSRWHDLVDWIGGYPFEVATPEAVADFCRARGFTVERLRTCGGRMGCNEFVFARTT